MEASKDNKPITLKKKKSVSAILCMFLFLLFLYLIRHLIVSPETHPFYFGMF